MHCQDLEVMGLNPDQVELWVWSTSVLALLEPKLKELRIKSSEHSVGNIDRFLLN